MHCGNNGLCCNPECIGRNNEEQSADHTVEDPTSCIINAGHTVVRGNMHQSNDIFNCSSCCQYQCTQARSQSAYDDRTIPYVVRVQCRIQRLQLLHEGGLPLSLDHVSYSTSDRLGVLYPTLVHQCQEAASITVRRLLETAAHCHPQRWFD